MDFTAVDTYLHQLHYTDRYTALSLEDRQRIVFTAGETLKNHYDERYLSTRVLALQTLYMIEGEEEEFSMFKRHGVKSVSMKGMSFSFEGGSISPDVITIIQKERGRAFIGRLI